jgi:hypothetical protein
VTTTNEVEESTAQLWLDDMTEFMNRAEQLGYDVAEDLLAKCNKWPYQSRSAAAWGFPTGSSISERLYLHKVYTGPVLIKFILPRGPCMSANTDDLWL